MKLKYILLKLQKKISFRNDRIMPCNPSISYECLICLDNTYCPYKLKCCPATYHKNCLYKWVQLTKTNKCLHCQKLLDNKVRASILNSYESVCYRFSYNNSPNNIELKK